MLIIQAKKREIKDNNDQLRQEGFMPAVVYGAGKINTMLSINIKDFIKVWKNAGESTTINLDTPDGSIEALIHDVQMDSVKSIPIHVDFLAIDANKVIEVEVPLEFIGVSEAVKTGAGVLVKILHELEIEALPKNLPHNIEVDISSLVTVDDLIKVKDLKLPTGVRLLNDEEDVVASISVQKDEVEVEGSIDLSQIEVEKKGKKEEEIIPAE